MLVLKGHKGRLRCLAFSPDGRFLASAAGHGTSVSLWDTTLGKRIGFLGGHHSRISCLAFAPGPGNLLASGGGYGWIFLWDVDTRQQRARLAPQGLASCLAFSPDGQTLATAVGRFTGYSVSLCGVESGKRQGTLRGDVTNVWALAFLGGRSLAVGHDRGVDFWDLGTRKRLGQFAQPAPVRALACSPDGRTLAFSCRQTVTLWDTQAGAVRSVLEGHERLVNGLAFSSDGRTLASASNDGVVRLHDPATGRERAAYDWQLGQVRAVAIAPDAMRAAAGGDHDIVIWDLEDD